MQYPLEIDYDYGAVDKSIFAQAPLPGLERWAALLPPLADISLGEGGTPLLPSTYAARLAGFDGDLLLKDESRNPTGSHKDRLNFCAVSAALLSGARGIVVASSGNHAAAAAAYSARAGLPCIAVVGPSTKPAFREMFAAFGAEVVVVPLHERWALTNRLVRETGFIPVSNLTRYHTSSAFGPEGYKTIAYELYLQLGCRAPGSVIIPTAYGELLFGVAKGFWEMTRLGLIAKSPTIMSAEPPGGPLARSFALGLPAMEVEVGATVAASIASPVSGYRGIRALHMSGGRALTFHENTLLAVHEGLSRSGFWQEASGVAGLSALKEAIADGERFNEPIVVILTSGGFKDLVADPEQMPLSDTQTIEILVNRFQRHDSHRKR